MFCKFITIITTLFISSGLFSSEIYELKNFGKVDSPQAAEQTFKKAKQAIIAKGGGILFISNSTAADFDPHSVVQQKLSGNSVMIVDIRGGKTRMVMPSLGYRLPNDPHGYGNLFLDRQINQTAINPNGMNSNLRISNRVIKGLTSYFQMVKEYQLQPNDLMKVYPPTMAGLNVGAVLSVMQGRGKKGRTGEFEASSSLTANVVKLGWDKSKNAGYILLEKVNQRDRWGKLTALINKSSAGAIHIGDIIHCDGEMPGTISMEKKFFGQGDSFGMGMRYMYMGNIMSCMGDENGCGYTVDTWQMLDSFQGKVQKWDPKTGEMIYTMDSRRANTLGTSRPMINLNQDKWITRGKIKIMANNSSGGIATNGYIMGIGVNWSPAIIGRAIAVDTPEEYCGTATKGFWKLNLAGRKVRRWWRITNYQKTANGEQRIWIERTRWAAYPKATPTLINEKNYYKELPYIIAPCTLVTDVSDGILAENKTSIKGRSIMPKPGDKRLVRLAPTGDTGTKFDFAPGDPVEQAIGPDPRHVIGVRVRHREANPSTLPSASFYSINNGAYPVYAALLVSGAHDNMQIPYHNKYRSGVEIAASSDNAIKITGKTGNAAILLKTSKGQSQKVIWSSAKHKTSLSAVPETGDLKLEGGALDTSGGQIINTSGISMTGEKSFNLRGINVKVPAGQKEFSVHFTRPEPNADYAISVTPNWLTNLAVVSKNNSGFRVVFGTAAPAKAGLDWILIR